MRLTTKLTTLVLLVALFATFGVAAPAGVQLDVQTIKTEPTPVETGTYADVWMKVRNTGNIEATDATITFVPEYPFSVDEGEKTEWNLGTINPGEEYRFHFETRVAEDAVTGNNSLVFRTSSGNNDIAITKRVPVEVRADAEALVVDKVFFPDAVAPGTRKRMTLQLNNLGDAALRNLAVELDVSSDDLPFATVGTTRQRLPRIGSETRQNVSFTLHMEDDADLGVYKLPVTLTYENQAGTEFSNEQRTGIVVGGTPRISVAVDGTEVQQAGASGAVTFRIVNRGDGRARFLQMELLEDESYELLSPSSVYIGNMAPDDYQTAEFQVYTEPGAEELSVPVRLSYNDADGVMKNETRTVTMRLYSDAQLGRLTGGQGIPWPYALIALVLAGAGVWYWRRRR